ncbi:MAG TPA: VWA domain-containing protein [Candidatus Angelobacter sp.]|nr:VWA domain-containing protein [Candidatus Angelobacter sp.]
MLRTVIVLFLGSAFAASSESQQKSQDQSSAGNIPSRVSVGSNMVLVPVVVAGKHGKHIVGLTANDFELREDGKIRKISNFEEVVADVTPVKSAAPAPGSFTNEISAAHPKKLEIILVDLLNTPFSERAEARKGLLKFLSQSADPDTLMALMVLSSNQLTMVHNFSESPSVLVDAIQKLQAPVGSHDSPTLNTNGGNVNAEAKQLSTILAGEAANPELPSFGILKLHEDQAKADVSQQDQEGLMTLEAMQQIAQYFTALPGRKSLLWASTGFRFNSVTPWMSRSSNPYDWQHTVRMLQNANIAVYPVDLSGVGLAGQGDLTSHGKIRMTTMGQLSDPLVANHQTMEFAADSTGGKALYNSNNTAELLQEARQDSAEYYMLSFYAGSKEKDGWHKLSVRVDQEGARVRARSGYLFVRPDHVAKSSRQADELMALASALPSTALPLRGQWQQVERAGDKRKAHFSVFLLPGGVAIENGQINVDFLIAAFNLKGKEVARIGQNVERNLAADAVAQIKSEGIGYANALSLAPGEYDVHFVVRDNLTGRLGSISTLVAVR